MAGITPGIQHGSAIDQSTCPGIIAARLKPRQRTLSGGLIKQTGDEVEAEQHFQTHAKRVRDICESIQITLTKMPQRLQHIHQQAQPVKFMPGSRMNHGGHEIGNGGMRMVARCCLVFLIAKGYAPSQAGIVDKISMQFDENAGIFMVHPFLLHVAFRLVPKWPDILTKTHLRQQDSNFFARIGMGQNVDIGKLAI